jgi:hypothetical protein
VDNVPTINGYGCEKTVALVPTAAAVDRAMGGLFTPRLFFPLSRQAPSEGIIRKEGSQQLAKLSQHVHRGLRLHLILLRRVALSTGLIPKLK